MALIQLIFFVCFFHSLWPNTKFSIVVELDLCLTIFPEVQVFLYNMLRNPQLFSQNQRRLPPWYPHLHPCRSDFTWNQLLFVYIILRNKIHPIFYVKSTTTCASVCDKTHLHTGKLAALFSLYTRNSKKKTTIYAVTAFSAVKYSIIVVVVLLYDVVYSTQHYRNHFSPNYWKGGWISIFFKWFFFFFIDHALGLIDFSRILRPEKEYKPPSLSFLPVYTCKTFW